MVIEENTAHGKEIAELTVIIISNVSIFDNSPALNDLSNIAAALLEITIPHISTIHAKAQYKIKKNPNVFSSDALSFSARYLEI